MAVLANPVVSASGGTPDSRWAVLTFRNVTVGDTFDLGTLTAISPFVKVYAALFQATTNRTETTALATIAGTVVTVVGTGIAADGGLLFVVGE